MKPTTETYKFTKGQELGLDQIYFIQGLGGGDWWDHPDPDENGVVNDDEVIIQWDITIKITVSQ